MPRRSEGYFLFFFAGSSGASARKCCTCAVTMNCFPARSIVSRRSCPGVPPNNDHTLTTRAYFRLLHILLTESAYLIWTFRCECTIAEKLHTTREIQNRWLANINCRLNIDRKRASLTSRHPTAALMIRETWKPLLPNPTQLPKDWTTNHEVLVGIVLPRPSAPTEAT